MRVESDIEKKMNDTRVKKLKIGKIISDTKKELLTEAMATLILRASDSAEFDNDQKALVESLTHEFVEEKGYIKLRNEYATKTYALSEAVRIVDKYASIIEAEATKCLDPDIFTVDIEVKNAFYKELDGIDMESANDVIIKRVRNNVFDYMKNATIARDKIEEVIDQTKMKVEEFRAKRSMGAEQLAVKEGAMQKAAIIKACGFDKNPYAIVNQTITKDSYTNDKVKSMIYTDGKIDYDLVEKYSLAVYNFAEGLQGLKMASVNLENLKDIIKIK
jgi:hypothetical protein